MENKWKGSILLAQQLLISQIPNEDYSAILLNYVKDVEDIRDKVVNEKVGKNPD